MKRPQDPRYLIDRSWLVVSDVRPLQLYLGPRRATPVMTSTFENVSDIGVCLGLGLAPPANARVRSKRGAVHDGL